MNIIIGKKESKDVFRLFLLLNIFGYREENNSKGMSLFRKKINVKIKNGFLVDKYEDVKNTIDSHHAWYLINAIFEKNKNNKKLTEFILKLKEFSLEKDVKNLEKYFDKYFIDNGKKLLPVFKKEIKKIKKVVNKNVLVKKVIIILNPLDAYWRGYYVNNKDKVYLILGPGYRDNSYGLLRHEFLHMFISNFKLPKKILEGKISDELIKQGYGDNKILRDEYVVRAHDIIYKTKVLNRDINKEIKIEEKNNFNKIRNVVNFVLKQNSVTE